MTTIEDKLFGHKEACFLDISLLNIKVSFFFSLLPHHFQKEIVVLLCLKRSGIQVHWYLLMHLWESRDRLFVPLWINRSFTFTWIDGSFGGMWSPALQTSRSTVLSALLYAFTQLSQAGCDTRSIFKQSLTGLNSEFCFF